MIQIKGTSKGLRLVVDARALAQDPSALEQAVVERLQSTGGFLADAGLVIEVLEGPLDPGIVAALARAVSRGSTCRLLGIVVAEDGSAPDPGAETEFHLGNVRSGQTVSSSCSLVILGNVNPGGRVAAVGDLYVTGSLTGLAMAGIDGDTSRMIYAGRMDPLQLRIGDAMARGERFSESPGPECALVEEGRVALYPATEAIRPRSHHAPVDPGDHAL